VSNTTAWDGWVYDLERLRPEIMRDAVAHAMVTRAKHVFAEKDAEIASLRAELDAGPTLGQYNLLLGRVGAVEDANADLHASKDRVTAALREASAKIVRLTAARNVPVEYVITSGLEAAMAADPHREDGTILRTTDGERKAWAWKAAAKTWEQVP